MTTRITTAVALSVVLIACAAPTPPASYSTAILDTPDTKEFCVSLLNLALLIQQGHDDGMSMEQTLQNLALALALSQQHDKATREGLIELSSVIAVGIYRGMSAREARDLAAHAAFGRACP